MEIVVPKGTKGAYIDKYVSKDEMEFLLSAGTKYKIIDGGERSVKVQKYDFKQRQWIETEKKERFLKVEVLKNSGKRDMINKKMYPDKIAGVKRGTQMSFEKANSGNVNPNYGKSYGYSTNCQSCVVGFEARQRGYNVKTLPNTKGSMLEKLSRQTNLAWIDSSTGKNPSYISDKSKTYTAKTYKKYLESVIEPGKRYTLEFSWKGRTNSGHIVNIDRTEKGELRIKDNQRGNGEKSEWIGDNEISQYLNRLKYSRTIYGIKINTPPEILRIDNMEFDLNVVNQILEGSD